MVFSSGVFLFLFLPLFLACYYLTPPRWRSYAILAGSYVFYAWWRVDYLLLIVYVSVWSYLASLAIARGYAKAGLMAGLGGDLLALAYFKYFNFMMENVNAAAAAFGHAPFVFEHVILPIGISFHVFQSVSYVIDVYRRDTPPAGRMVDFLAFSSLFPQLIAGPVLRYKDLAGQFAERRHDWATFNEGAHRFALGFVKKLLIADMVAPLADLAFSQPAPTFAEAWLGVLAYAVQLYFDFSGYSDMAVGLGLMMGFRFIENFNRPYLSRSISEFWKRWHISLSTWLRDYLYIPLGGNRKGARRTTINLLVTMILGGFWHGANWTFILWGAWHGGLMAVERALGAKTRATVWPAAVALPLTLLFVLLGWVVFRAPDVTSALRFYGGMAGLHGLAFSDGVAWQISGLQMTALGIGLVLVFMPVRPKLLRGCLPVLFVLAVLRLSAQSTSPFLYFQF